MLYINNNKIKSESRIFPSPLLSWAAQPFALILLLHTGIPKWERRKTAGFEKCDVWLWFVVWAFVEFINNDNYDLKIAFIFNWKYYISVHWSDIAASIHILLYKDLSCWWWVVVVVLFLLLIYHIFVVTATLAFIWSSDRRCQWWSHGCVKLWVTTKIFFFSESTSVPLCILLCQCHRALFNPA